MYFSVGILYSAQEFLQFIKRTPGIGVDFSKLFSYFSLASSKAVLELSQKCEWVQLNLDGHLEVTDKGMQVLGTKSTEIALRVQLDHLIEAYRPSWIPLLSQGRSVAAKYLPIDVVQCFREAGLFASNTDEVVAWWDKIAKVSRKGSKDTKLDVGRKGEKLSIAYERKRVKKEPYWQSIESNLAGFDILSIVAESDARPLCIEVKTSNSNWQVAEFYISINEWRVADTSENYVFHLWSLVPAPKLFIVEVSSIAKHIPRNLGNGQWQSVEIPYSSVCSTSA
jgi:hypothetical protein